MSALALALHLALIAMPTPAEFAALSDAERKAAVQKLSRDEQAALFAQLTPEQLAALGQAALAALGPYEATLAKTERVGGKVLPEQVMRIAVREKPYASRLEVIAGPAKGRRVLYNPNVRPGQIRAKEAGLLGLAGAVWIDKDGSLAKGDTEHGADELGFGRILQLLASDARASHGTTQRKDEGFDAQGAYCIAFTAAPGTPGLYALKSRVCFDPVLALPVSIEVHDAQGFKERFLFSNVKPRALTEADFTPAAMGL